MIEYVPDALVDIPNLPNVHTTWRGLERLLPTIVKQFVPDAHLAIDFGVWYGFSTAALATQFKHVIGVDTFKGDRHAGSPTGLYVMARNALVAYPNIILDVESWEAYTRRHAAERKIDATADLIHIDIVHDYDPTYDLGRWACDHAPVVLFHDTESFPEVRKAVSDLADLTGRTFYNYPHHHGLGILV